MAQQQTQKETIKILERGSIYFLYRPAVEETTPQGLVDVQRFHIVLTPRNKSGHRLITIGRKQLPDAENPDARYWGFVQRVFKQTDDITAELGSQTYETETRGERFQPAVRPAGEGVYALYRYPDHTRLAYLLQKPEKLGEVQKALNIQHEGEYVINVKNPESGAPPGVGLREEERAELPEHLQQRFGARRFFLADPPDYLDYEGVEILLIGTDDEIDEKVESALGEQKGKDIFNTLRLDKDEHATEPLFKGKWA